MSDEKSFQYVKRILPLFRAVVKFCSTNRLFALHFSIYFPFILVPLNLFPSLSTSHFFPAFLFSPTPINCWCMKQYDLIVWLQDISIPLYIVDISHLSLLVLGNGLCKITYVWQHRLSVVINRLSVLLSPILLNGYHLQYTDVYL